MLLKNNNTESPKLIVETSVVETTIKINVNIWYLDVIQRVLIAKFLHEMIEYCDVNVVVHDIMGDENEYEKLPLQERLSHKLWKARLHGYEEAIKTFALIDDENSSEYNKYVGQLKSFAVEVNALAQDTALDAIISFLTNAAISISGRSCSGVVSGIVTKRFNAKPKVKSKAIDVCLMYVEIEQPEITLEEVIKGLSNKQPKIVAACAEFIKESLKAFGAKVIPIKSVLKILPKIFEHSDKGVREEAKQIAIDAYRWVGAAVKPALQTIKPVQLKELEEEWEKLGNERAIPTRFLRSQQAQQQKLMAGAAAAEGDSVDVSQAGAPVETVNPLDLIDPVDILPKLPADFFKNLSDKKWQNRKEALEALQALLTANPKLEPADYSDLMKELKRMIGKDTNVYVVCLAAKCVAGIASGLRKKFCIYVSLIFSTILEKFKEKKLNVVTALREATDGLLLTTTIASFQDDIILYLDNKNPSVKAETALFVARAFAKSSAQALSKAVLKPICGVLVKKMEDTDPQVRNNSAEALGTALKVVGERPMNSFLDGIDKIKLDKIKECAEKAEVNFPSASLTGSKKPATAATTEKAKEPSKTSTATKSQPPTSKPAKKPTKPKKESKKTTASTSKDSNKDSNAAKNAEELLEPNITPEEVDTLAAEVMSEELLKQLVHSNWKERIAACEELDKLIDEIKPENLKAFLFIQIIAKKPGFKDTNFQAMKAKCKLVTKLAKTPLFGKRSASFVLSAMVDKCGDIKVKNEAIEALTEMTEKLSLDFIGNQVITYAMSQKSPKVISESICWLAQAIKEFGFKIKLKSYLTPIKAALSHTNPTVRTSAINLLGVMHMYIGDTLRTFFEDEKSALLSQIDAEFSKVSGQKPPDPIRGLSGNKPNDEKAGSTGASSSATVVNVADLIPRNDISDQITDDLIQELGDKSWKVRGEAISKVGEIVSAAKFITPNLGELPGALKDRFSDSNKNLVVNALGIASNIAAAMGPPIQRQLKTFLPAILNTLGDGKTSIRGAAINALNALEKEVSLKPVLEGDTVALALANDSPNSRSEILGWLEQKLSNAEGIPTADVTSLVLPLFSCLEDRNADVRKKGQALIPVIIKHIGYDATVKLTGKLKASSKQVVVALLEKHKGTSAAQTTTNTTTHKSADNKQENQSKSLPAKKGKNASSSKVKSTASSKSSDNSNTEQNEATLILYNGKDARLKDEKDLKARTGLFFHNLIAIRSTNLTMLKDQMSKCCSKDLLDNLFSPDFKHHLIGLNKLNRCISPTPSGDIPCKAAALASVDLLLKWTTLRFFDTNPSVLVKCLDFLQALFNILIEENHVLIDMEASAFLPYLITKLGDSKEAVRSAVHAILKSVRRVYPASKIYPYVTEGLKSKSSRPRIECLEELGSMISAVGINICQPSPQKAIANIAEYSNDRDNSVRTAALNVLVECYALIGNDIYKFTNNILNDRDKSVLEEKIKRNQKQKPPAPVKPPVEETRARSATEGRINTGVSSSKLDFRLDYEKLEVENSSLGQDSIPTGLISSKDVDELMNQPPIVLPTSSSPERAKRKTVRNMGGIATTSGAIDFIISQITNKDISTSAQALGQLETVLRDPQQSDAISEHVDQFLVAYTLQLRLIMSTHLNNESLDEEMISHFFRRLISCLLKFVETPTYFNNTSKDVLRDLISNLISLIPDERITHFGDGPQIIRALNVLMAKVLEKPNPNVILCALIKLLGEAVASDKVKGSYGELLAKCLWRVTKTLPVIINLLRLDELLVDLDGFFRAQSGDSWRKRAEIPLRTIKTILHTLATIQGNKLLNRINLIKDPDTSEAVLYLRKILKNAPQENQENQENNTISSQSGKNSSKESNGNKDVTPHQLLAAIFKKIGSKENTREGLAELYDFKQKYPMEDITPFLKKTSTFFQAYIERGLKNIEQERYKSNQTVQPTQSNFQPEKSASATINTNVGVTKSLSSEDSSTYLDRLRVLRARYGLENNENTSRSVSSISTKASNNGKLAPDSIAIPSIKAEDASTDNSDEANDLVTKNVANVESAKSTESKISNVTDLRRRLEKIKNSSS
ncbi:Cytoskeleton-associated protein 5 [Trichoplax sp. H2]|nr:Cytoskeleton-associated protein 5 [Trichoplax sp. H2]|eukprot:RDD44949.1 Cytoskeleton-associated protein 5 [Trichoplax sp. H2]